MNPRGRGSRTARALSRIALRRRRAYNTALLTCIAVAATVTALLWPAALGPPLGPLEVEECRGRLADAVSALERGLSRGPEVSLSIDQDTLCVLATDLAGVPDARGLRLRIRPDYIAVGLRISAPVGVEAHARLVIQPSLLDGHVFLGLHEVRIGLLPVPPRWFASLQSRTGADGWQLSRGQPGLVLPGRLWHQGMLLEVSDLWLTSGWIEVLVRKVVSPGDP